MTRKDTIYRDDAISIPVLPKEHREYQTNNLDDAYELGWYDCQKYIGQLPSAQKQGKWIQPSGVLTVICSECKHINNSNKWNYCPHCGARMVGEEE